MKRARIKTLLIIGAVASSLLLALLAMDFGPSFSSERRKRMLASSHFDGSRFTNKQPLENLWRPGSVASMLGSWLFGGQKRNPTKPLPVITHSSGTFTQHPKSGLRVTWMGHSTTLIEIDGRRLLTDPVWSTKAPDRFWGARRFHPLPMALYELPPIDAVLISHDHFDHLDRPTIEALARKPLLFFVPLGVGQYLEDWGIRPQRIKELDWWEKGYVGDLQVIATPARHFSGRALGARDRTMWASWTIVGPDHRVFFGGDSGPCDCFKRIGTAYGPFDITLLDAGAYDQLWPGYHLNPQHAVHSHKALQGRVMLPIHWSTFNLAFHHWYEPATWVLQEAEKHGVQVVLPRPGQIVDSSHLPVVERWWESDPSFNKK